jgi:predicted nuclease with TOPRIM domain
MDILNLLASADTLASLLTLIAGAISILAGASSYVKLLRLFGQKVVQKAPESYKERMAKLIQSLTKASADVDYVLQEMAEVSHERESAIAKLEEELKSLAEREKHLQEKVETLEKVPLPAVEHFVSILEKGEKRSALRDYALFGAGVVVSAVMSIVFKLFGF